MARRRPYDECEELRKELHSARATIKSLRKRLKTLEQQLRFQEQIIDSRDEPEERARPTKTATCSNCGKGILSVLDLGVKHFEVCNLCTYRKIIR